MDFGKALTGLKSGLRYTRSGWNGKHMFIFLVQGSTFVVNREPLLSLLGEGAEVSYSAHIDILTAQGYVTPWLASQADMLAEDWVEVTKEETDTILADRDPLGAAVVTRPG